MGTAGIGSCDVRRQPASRRRFNVTTSLTHRAGDPPGFPARLLSRLVVMVLYPFVLLNDFFRPREFCGIPIPSRFRVWLGWRYVLRGRGPRYI